jgi:hypothetical protein
VTSPGSVVVVAGSVVVDKLAGGTVDVGVVVVGEVVDGGGEVVEVVSTDEDVVGSVVVPGSVVDVLLGAVVVGAMVVVVVEGVVEVVDDVVVLVVVVDVEPPFVDGQTSPCDVSLPLGAVAGITNPAGWNPIESWSGPALT